MVDLPSITNMINVPNIASGIASTSNILTYIFIGLIVGGGIFFMMWKTKIFFKYPNSADIFKMKGGQPTFVSTDYIRTVKDKKMGPAIEFKHSGKRWNPPTHEAFIQMKKGSKLYLEELIDGGYKIIDMKTLLSATPADYKRFENEELDRFYKNTQDDAAFNKYQMKKTDWQKFIDAIGPASMVIAVGIFFWLFGQFFLIPFMTQVTPQIGAILTQLTTASTQLTQTVDAQTRYMEVILKQAGIEMPTNMTYGNSSVIP